MLMHASCVAVNGAGILIRGDAGCGKSDLALRLIDGGAKLIADDQVELTPEDDQLIATCPKTISGLIEVRHVGLLATPNLDRAAIALVLDPGQPGLLERLPEPATIPILGLPIAALRLPYFEASTPAKLRLLLAQTLRDTP